MEPIVRVGGEPFESHYESEFHLETYIADPRRSFVKPLYQMSDKWVDGAWWVADFLACFLLDLGFNLSNPTKAMSVAFWTMFPEGVSRHLSVSWRRIACFNRCHGDIPRVINNPFFYCDSNVAERGCCRSWKMQVALMQSILQTLMKTRRRLPVTRVSPVLPASPVTPVPLVSPVIQIQKKG